MSSHNNNFTVDINLILQKLQTKLDINNIGVIYIYGSNLWNTVTKMSDIDIIVVLNAGKDDNKQSIHIDNIDAMILTYIEYIQKLQQHEFLIVLTQLYPMEIYRSKNFKKVQFNLNLNKFKLNIVDRIRKDLIRIEKEKIKEKNDYKSNKIIIYDVRMINIYNNIKNGEEINVFVPQEIFELENNNDVLKEAHMQLIMDFLL